jgi:hypothetical protein
LQQAAAMLCADRSTGVWSGGAMTQNHEGSSISAAEKALVIILRVLGVIVLAALFAVVMPQAWMAATNRWLGLAELPDTPLVGYLTRSLSAMYAMHGALLVFISYDIRRYAALLRFLALMGVAFGITMLVLDLAVGMPWWWTLNEGPLVIPLYIVIYCLAMRIGPTPPSE